jgi:hypothetical protein
LLSRYLEVRNYDGLRVLRLYAVYRALVRAKIDAIGTRALPPEAAQAMLTREAERLRIATELTVPRQPSLLITQRRRAAVVAQRRLISGHAVRALVRAQADGGLASPTVVPVSASS